MGGNGPWAVAGGANAVWLEYYVDGVIATSEKRCEANSSGQCTGSGTWYFSKSNVACGSRTFLLKAWPMVIDSSNNETTCWGSLRTVSQVVTEECPIVCGNSVCETGEDGFNCAQDCASCGNSVCETGENGFNCAPDCASCGNGVCETDEYGWNCSQDCAICGNGLCERPAEDSGTCNQDCCEGCNDM
jgi:hypothetical protein